MELQQLEMEKVTVDADEAVATFVQCFQKQFKSGALIGCYGQQRPFCYSTVLLNESRNRY